LSGSQRDSDRHGHHHPDRQPPGAEAPRPPSAAGGGAPGASKSGLLLAAVVGALFGAGGYWAAEHLGRRPAPPPAPAPAPAPVPVPAPAPAVPPVSSVDMAKLWKALADLEERLAQLEVMPVPGETPKPPAPGPGEKPIPLPPTGPRPPVGPGPKPVAPQPPALLTDYRRMEMAAGHRAEYERLLGEIQAVLAADAARWNALVPAFEKHFAPVEAALKDLEAGKSAAAPKVNELVRPNLPALIEAIRRAAPPESWKAFDAWRRSVADAAGRWTTKGDYLLDGEDHRDFQARLTAAQYWPVISEELGRFYEAAKPDEAKRRKLEERLKAHLDKVCRILLAKEDQDLADPGVMEKVKPVTKATEAEVGTLLGAAGLTKFKDWEIAAGGRVSYFFGKPPRPWIGDVVTRGYTAELFVNVDGRKPNLLVADGAETTEVVLRDLKKRPGLTVRFSADCGKVESEPKVTDEKGLARATYTADGKTSTATIKAEVAGGGEDGEPVVLTTYVYNEAFNFRDLSKNKGVGGYTDEAFVQSEAMTREQVQAFLAAKGSFLAAYSEDGKSAAEIIKAAADKHGVNPKVILVTLQKEQSLITRKNALSVDAVEMRNAMGVRPKLARTFSSQVDAGTRVLRQRFEEPISFFPVPVKNKYGPDGRATQAFREMNHIYVVPSTGNENVWAPVGFEPLTRATHAQHRYTNYVTHRPDTAVGKWQLPCGGVHLFVSTWQKLIGE
jgi:hypothetical protein